MIKNQGHMPRSDQVIYYCLKIVVWDVNILLMSLRISKKI